MSSPLFFLHIPKTAGTTLNTILDSNFASGKILNLYTDEQHQVVRGMTYNRLATYSLVRGHIFVQDYAEILDGPVPMRMFTFLRDPIERVISEYFFLKHWPKSHLYKYLNEKNVTLIDYVTKDTGRLRQRGCNNMTNSLSGVHTRSLQERLSTAWHHLKDRFVFFGVMDRFDESLLMLKKQIGLSETFYERQNVRAVHADRIVSESEIEIVREYNQLDIKLYDAAMVEFDKRVVAMGPDFQSELRMFNKVNIRYQRVADLMNRQTGLEQGALVNAK